MTTTRVVPPHALAPAPEEHAFRFSNGDAARSLEEFVTIVPKLPPEVVDYHRAHYHYWLQDVVGDASLARRVEQFAGSGMSPDELRRTLVDVGTARLDELRNGGKPKRTPKKRAPKKASAKKTPAKKPAVKKKGKKL